MSGSTVGRALESRFNAILRAEIERLDKKLRSLTAEDRQTVEALTADIIQAIARVPAERLAGEVPAHTVDAVVRLFALDSDATPAAP